MQEPRVQSLGWEDPLEESIASHSSILAWRIPWTEESGWVHGVAESDMTKHKPEGCGYEGGVSFSLNPDLQEEELR